jgi:hypothetical protein
MGAAIDERVLDVAPSATWPLAAVLSLILPAWALVLKRAAPERLSRVPHTIERDVKPGAVTAPSRGIAGRECESHHTPAGAGARSCDVRVEHGSHTCRIRLSPAVLDVRSRVLKTERRMPSPTLGSFLTSQWLPTIEHTVRPSTFTSYRSHVTLHIAPRIGDVAMDALDAASLNRLYSELLVIGEPSGREVCHPRPCAAYTQPCIERCATRSGGDTSTSTRQIAATLPERAFTRPAAGLPKTYEPFSSSLTVTSCTPCGTSSR